MMNCTNNIDICFSSSEDEEPIQGNSNTSKSSILHSQTLQSNENLVALPGITEVTPMTIESKEDIGEPSQRMIGTQQESSIVEEQNEVADVDMQLENLQKRQQKLQRLLMKGLELHVSEKKEVREEYRELQMLLANVNKELSSHKKYIKETRDFQLTQGSQSQAEYQDLLKKAKRLVVQQKCLVNLLKTHKEMAANVRRLFDDGHKTSSKTNPSQLQQQKQQHLQQQQLQQQQHLRQQQKQQQSQIYSQAKQFAQSVPNNQTIPKECSTTASGSTLLKKLIDSKIIHPGIDVLSIAIKGVRVVATLRDDGMIVSTKGVYESAEEWISKERAVQFSKKTVMRMVKFSGTTIATLIRNYKIESSSAKAKAISLVGCLSTGSSQQISQQIEEKASTFNMQIKAHMKQQMLPLERINAAGATEFTVVSGGGCGDQQNQRKFPVKNTPELTISNGEDRHLLPITNITSLANITSSANIASSANIPSSADITSSANITSSAVANIENFSQSQIAVDIPTQNSQRSTELVIDHKFLCSTIKTYGAEEFVKCSDVLPSNFWTVGFEMLSLYDDLVAGCVDF